jgi:hypothetical protein
MNKSYSCPERGVVVGENERGRGENSTYSRQLDTAEK